MASLREQLEVGSQGGQASLTTIIAKKTEIEELRKTEATLTAAIGAVQTKYQDSLSDARLKLSSAMSKKSFLLKSNTTCVSTNYDYNQVYCTQTLPNELRAADTLVTEAETAVTTLTANIQTESASQRTSLESLRSQIT